MTLVQVNLIIRLIHAQARIAAMTHGGDTRPSRAMHVQVAELEQELRMTVDPAYADRNEDFGSIDGRTIATLSPASISDIAKMTEANLGVNGRSHYQWATFTNGDVALITFPLGELFLKLQDEGAFHRE